MDNKKDKPVIEVVKHHKKEGFDWAELKYFLKKYYLLVLIIVLIPLVLYSLGQQLANSGSAAPRLNLKGGAKVGTQQINQELCGYNGGSCCKIDEQRKNRCDGDLVCSLGEGYVCGNGGAVFIYPQFEAISTLQELPIKIYTTVVADEYAYKVNCGTGGHLTDSDIGQNTMDVTCEYSSAGNKIIHADVSIQENGKYLTLSKDEYVTVYTPEQTLGCGDKYLKCCSKADSANTCNAPLYCSSNSCLSDGGELNISPDRTEISVDSSVTITLRTNIASENYSYSYSVYCEEGDAGQLDYPSTANTFSTFCSYNSVGDKKITASVKVYDKGTYILAKSNSLTVKAIPAWNTIVTEIPTTTPVQFRNNVPTTIPTNTMAPAPTKAPNGARCSTASQCASSICKTCPDDTQGYCRPSGYICPL